MYRTSISLDKSSNTRIQTRRKPLQQSQKWKREQAGADIPILDKIETFAQEWEKFIAPVEHEQHFREDDMLEPLAIELHINSQTRVHSYNTVLFNQLLRKINSDAQIMVSEIHNIYALNKKTPTWHVALYRGATRALCVRITTMLAEGLSIGYLATDSYIGHDRFDLESFERATLHHLIDSTTDYGLFLSTNKLEDAVLCDNFCHCASGLQPEDHGENIENGHDDIVIIHPDDVCELKPLCLQRWMLMKPMLLAKHMFKNIKYFGSPNGLSRLSG